MTKYGRKEEIEIPFVVGADPNKVFNQVIVEDLRSDPPSSTAGYVSSIELKKDITSIDKIVVRIDSGYRIVFYVPTSGESSP